jgi:hypothetical protein
MLILIFARPSEPTFDRAIGQYEGGATTSRERQLGIKQPSGDDFA